MLNRQYSWRYGHGVPAQVAGETIEKIEERDGAVTAKAFLDESRPEESPTHGCFEWDDTKAAERWRLWQANQTIRDLCVTIVSENVDEEPIKVPVFVNTERRVVTTARFMSVDSALEDEDHRRVVLQNALDELRAFEHKYAKLTELSEVFTAARKARTKTERRNRRGKAKNPMPSMQEQPALRHRRQGPDASRNKVPAV